MAVDLKNINLDVIKKLPMKQKAYILAGVLVLISGLYWYFVYNPKSVELAGLVANLEKLKAELNESRAIAADLPKFREEVARLTVKSKRLITRNAIVEADYNMVFREK